MPYMLESLLYFAIYCNIKSFKIATLRKLLNSNLLVT